ncbi:hypothetical protein acdb102_31250 [Acidothermaceae bacterium B102]|nr:hypothetical protein acdb102_31250 [Acidothermaceae bacterium B102]
MSGILSQFGVSAETTFGTTVAASRFFEFNKESVAGKYDRIESAGLRAATRVQRSDRWVVNPKGAAGSVDVEVQSKGFGFWLTQMMGHVSSGTVVDSTYTHTGSVASMNGNSFSAQFGRPDISQTVRPFTYSGGKILTWELSNQVDGLLVCTLGVDFATEATTGSGAYALQTPSYPTSSQLMSYIAGSFQLGGTEVSVKDISIKGDNGLDAGRYFIRTLGGKKEQNENTMRKYTVDVTAEFESMTQYNAVSSASASGAMATLSARWQSPTLAGATTYPSLTATATVARYEGATPLVEGPKILEQKLSFVLLYDGTNSPLSLAYTTTDTTP